MNIPGIQNHSNIYLPVGKDEEKGQELEVNNQLDAFILSILTESFLQ